jgi:hypothetical protein
MALTIEDGTGVTGADSYGTRSGFISHVADYYGGTVADEDASDVPMRAAFAYLNGLKWRGTKTLLRAQVGAWPRTSVTDCDGNDIDTDEIPTEVIQAQYDLAWAEKQTPGTLTPSGSIRNALVSREKVDVVEVEYDTSRMVPGEDYLSVRVEAAMRLIDCFLSSGGDVRGTYAVSV